MTLADHLARAAAQPWGWGQDDCSTFPADWILDQSGRDPMAEWRGAYDSESGADALIDEAGGLVQLFARGIDPIWRRVDEPSEGAVGVVTLRGSDGIEVDVGAIHTGRRWAVRSPRGLACFSQPLAVRAMWAR